MNKRLTAVMAIVIIAVRCWRQPNRRIEPPDGVRWHFGTASRHCKGLTAAGSGAEKAITPV